MGFRGGWTFVVWLSVTAACSTNDSRPSGMGGMPSGGAAQGGSTGAIDAGEGGRAGSMLGGAGRANAGGAGMSGGAGSQAGSGGSDGACSNIDLQSDPDHCGQCRRSCRGAACVDGLCAPVRLLEGYISPHDFTIDATTIYFQEVGVSSVPKAGGTPTLLVEPPSVRELQVYDGRLYFAREADDEEDTQGVYSIPVTGGTETTVFAGLDQPLNGLAVRDERVFFMGGCADVWAAPRAGGMPERIWPTSCNAFSGPFVVSPSGAHGYYRDADRDALVEIDLTTAEVTLLEEHFYSQNILASDDTVYFVVETFCEGGVSDRVCHGGRIASIARPGGNKKVLLDLAKIEKPEGYEQIGKLAFDGDELFFELIEIGHQERRLFALPLTGEAPRLLAVLKGGSGAGIEVDEAFVYVLHDGRRLHRVPK